MSQPTEHEELLQLRNFHEKEKKIVTITHRGITQLVELLNKSMERKIKKELKIRKVDREKRAIKGETIEIFCRKKSTS